MLGLEGEFGHLRPREASIAYYVDRLDEGADLSVKTLAKELPYGQCALRTALRLLSEAGHLRRMREHMICVSGGRRWVTRTYFSRTPRSDAWWASFRAGERLTASSGPAGSAPPPAGEPESTTAPAPSETSDGTPSGTSGTLLRRAYEVLARLGLHEFRMSLSEAACQELAPLAARWLERGADEARLTHELVSSLPLPIYHNARFARQRLIAKLPPPLPVEPTGTTPTAGDGRTVRPPLRLLECTVCQTPGRPDALPGGICRDCRSQPVPRPELDAGHLSANVQRVRDAAGLGRVRQAPPGTRPPRR